VFRLAVVACSLVFAAAAFAPADERAPATGRELYAREACWQCHVHAGDRAFPPVEGTGRTGPVLGGALRPVRSREWLRALFHEPRALLPESVMPA